MNTNLESIIPLLNKNLKINNANELLVKAHYSYNKERGQFEEGKGGMIKTKRTSGNVIR